MKKRLKALIRLFLLIQIFYFKGLTYILFDDSQVVDFTFTVDVFDEEAEMISLVERMNKRL